MDWCAVVMIASLAAAVAALLKLYFYRREVYRFADRVEKTLDDMLAGRELSENEEEVRDTLWGKCGEKFARLGHISRKREETVRREKEQMKELISDISHQTRIPIANMKLYGEFLETEPLSEKGREFLTHLEGQTEKLEFLIQSMVKMSRLETGVIQIRREPEDLRATLVEALAEAVPQAAKKEIELSVDCEESLMLSHDRKWTREAVFNVLDNAVKYTDTGGKIHVSMTRQEMFTKISVKDTGKGIAEDRQAQIFTRFYREPEVHGENGVGIGLYLARKILELQGGYIEVRSRAGEGAEFCLYLPNVETV